MSAKVQVTLMSCLSALQEYDNPRSWIKQVITSQLLKIIIKAFSVFAYTAGRLW